MEVPLQVMHRALDSMPLLAEMARTGNPASVSDAGVGALCARAAVRGAFLNIRINADELEDQEVAGELIAKGQEIDSRARELESEILAIAEAKL